MSILVTGGSGYIGSHTCIELLKSGYDIVVIDNLSNSNYECIKRIEIITGESIQFHELDLLNQEAINKIFDDNNIEAVIHLAGFKSVNESVIQPLKYYKNNIISTLILCEVMKVHNVKKIVFSSSATVYGMENISPLIEELKLNPTSPYGRTKVMIEEILSDLYCADKEWGISILRYFNPIGAHESGWIGEDPKGIPNNLMPYITQVAIGKISILKVFGNNYATHDGTGVRDYIHVVDLAKGHLQALERLFKHDGIEVFNLGTGIGYSVLDVIKAFESATGILVPYVISPRRSGDIDTCYADPQKAIRMLGWRCEKSIEEMCKDSWNWQVENPNGYENEKRTAIADFDFE